MSNKTFRWKVFISISLFFSFFIIFLTGIVLYLSPAGRVAYWVNWKLIGLNKEQWQSLHTVFSYLFAILSIFHLFTMNWKAFWSYIKNKVGTGLNKKREFFFSTFATLLVFMAVLIKIPPFSSIMTFGEYLTASWETKDEEAPIPHAEKLTIPQLVEQLEGYSTDQVVNRLKNNQIILEDLNISLKEIGELHNLSPNEIFKIITYKPANDMAGTGVGKKTLEQLAKENNKEVEEYLNILNTNNIKAEKTNTLKELASEYNMPAREIYEMLMEDK